MHLKMKNVISISRRTDIPRWHTTWLLKALKEKQATYLHPTRRISSISLRPEEVHTLVLWSKDYRNFLEESELLKYLSVYNIYLHFTITGMGQSFWEPRTIDPAEALTQMGQLVKIFGAEKINWRFDPILFWKENGSLKSNAVGFEQLAYFIRNLGIERCTFSFAQWYGKCIRRVTKHGIAYVDPPLETKEDTLALIAQTALSSQLQLFCCAQNKWVGRFSIKQGKCINGELLASLAGGEPAPLEKDTSQRSQCGCTQSIDIGSYSQSCYHNCLYCYANPKV